MGLYFRDYFAGIDKEYREAKYIKAHDAFYAYGRKVSSFAAPQSPTDMYLEDFTVLEKGCLIKWEGHKYPMRAYIVRENIMTLTQFKRVIPLWFRFFAGKGEFKETTLFQKLVIGVAISQYWKYFLELMHWGMRDIFLEENKYNQPAREFYRVIKNKKIRDIVCAIVEYDSAYKYRVQDILNEVHKMEFEVEPLFKRLVGYLTGKHSRPVREIKRLVEMVEKREQGGDDGIKGGLAKSLILKKYLFLYLEFNQKLLKEICQIIWRLDIEAAKPTIEDKYWMYSGAYENRYDFGGLPYPERARLRKVM